MGHCYFEDLIDMTTPTHTPTQPEVLGLPASIWLASKSPRRKELLSTLGIHPHVFLAQTGPEAERLGGKQQFPLLIDSNSGVVLYESAAIIEYLFKAYGRGETPSRYKATALNKAESYAATIARGLKGLKVKPSQAPAQPLELWSFEASPYSRLVRERMCELELPYTLHNLGKEQWADVGPATMRVKPGPYVPVPGGKREAFLQQYGRVQLPYLEDANTGAALFESEDILAYLDKTYAR